MSGTSTPEQRIHVVDAFACTLYHHIKQHPTQNDIADIIGELHGCLRRLNAEVSDLNSLLRDPRSAYSGQLISVIDDCDGTLRHLQYTLSHQGRALGVIRSQLWNRISSINRLIDAVQTQRHRSMRTTPKPSHGRGRRDSKEAIPRSSSRNDYSYYPISNSAKPKAAPPPIPPKIPLDKAYNQATGASSSESSSDNYSYILTTSISTNDMMAKDGIDARSIRPSSRSQSHHRRGNSLPIGRTDTAYIPQNSYSSSHLSELPGSSSFRSQSGPFSSSPSQRGHILGSGLAPDSHGQPIPLDAEWTKIDRDIVSPGVLELARVRYEARPSYVAVLGRLSKEQVSAFARQTVNYRAGRPIHPEDWQLSSSRARGKSQRRSSNSSNDSKNESISSRSTVDPRRKRASTTSDVPPKSVLKKRSMNRVRFDPNPEEIKPKSNSTLEDSEKAQPSRSQSYDERDGHTYQLSGGSPPRRPRSASRANSLNDRPRSYSYDVDRDYYTPKSEYDDFDRRSYRGDGRRSRLSISGTANRLLSALSSKSSSQGRRDRDLAYS